jgi:hypothetical protein
LITSVDTTAARPFRVRRRALAIARRSDAALASIR